MVLLAHAFGKRYELPLPLVFFVLGAAVVVFLSFLLVQPRQVQAEADAGDPGRDGAAPVRGGVLAQSVGVLLLALLAVAGVVGSQEVAENILPTAFWLVVWIAVPLSCGLLGDWTAGCNPFAAAARLGDSDRARRLLLGSERTVGWPSWLGWWPATVAFFAVACGELIFNQTATLPRVTAYGLLAQAVLSLVAGFFFGADAWLGRGELFSVLFATWGRLGWFRFGAPGRRGLGGGLTVPFEAVGSRLAFVLMLLVSVSFDGLLATPAWSSVRLRLLHATTAPPTAVEWETVAAFLLLGLGTWLVFGAFAWAVARVGGSGGGRGTGLRALTGLLPSLLPIAFGYLLAHNLQYLLVNGQLLVPLAGNPTGLAGGQWLPAPFNDSFEVHPNFLPSAVYWYVAVAVIVAVHIAAVVIAHWHLASEPAGPQPQPLRRDRARASEWPWIVAMVAYTMVSLVLLAQPLVKEGPAQPAPAPVARR